MREDRPSSTAVFVALAQAGVSPIRSAGPASAEAIALADWLRRNLPKWQRVIIRLGETRAGDKLARGLERLIIPNLRQHFTDRKAALAHLAMEWRKECGKQIVILGAGFDALGVRLANDASGTLVWEVDHPATHAWKQRAVRYCRLGSPRLHLVASGIASSGEWESRLLAAGFEPGQPAFWMAEGLTMYLTGEEVAAMLRTVRRMSQPRSRIAFTHLEANAAGRADFHRGSALVRHWLASRKESFSWGISRRELPAFLDDLGFRNLRPDPSAVAKVEGLGVGEYIALAEVP